MPIHDWTSVKAGIYHNFHVLWTTSITNRLNAGLLPAGFFAMAEQIIGDPEADVVTLQAAPGRKLPARSNGGVAVAPMRPNTRFVLPFPPDQQRYAHKAKQVVVRQKDQLTLVCPAAWR